MPRNRRQETTETKEKKTVLFSGFSSLSETKWSGSEVDGTCLVVSVLERVHHHKFRAATKPDCEGHSA